MQLMIAPDGRIRCLYDEQIDLAELGGLEITRASFVEPDQHGSWIADLSPVGGPILGPLPRRSVALDREREWLDHHWLRPTRL